MITGNSAMKYKLRLRKKEFSDTNLGDKEDFKL